MSIPKTLFGIGLTLLGAVVSTVPIVQAAGPVLVKTGAGIILIGVAAKAARAKKGGDPMEHERKLIQRIRRKKDGSSKEGQA